MSLIEEMVYTKAGPSKRIKHRSISPDTKAYGKIVAITEQGETRFKTLFELETFITNNECVIGVTTKDGVRLLNSKKK